MSEDIKLPTLEGITGLFYKIWEDLYGNEPDLPPIGLKDYTGASIGILKALDAKD